MEKKSEKANSIISIPLHALLPLLCKITMQRIYFPDVLHQ